jgi:hypothetical protein
MTFLKTQKKRRCTTNMALLVLKEAAEVRAAGRVIYSMPFSVAAGLVVQEDRNVERTSNTQSKFLLKTYITGRP